MWTSDTARREFNCRVGAENSHDPNHLRHVGDPVASGLVHSLAQPGGNVTGFTAAETSIGGKWVALLKEIAPRVERLSLLFDPQNPTSKFHMPTIEAAASSAPALPVTAVPVRSSADIESAIGVFTSKANGALIVLPSADRIEQCPLSGVTRKTFAHIE